LFVKLPEKIKILTKGFLENRSFLTRIHDPQISNQIDATATKTRQTKPLKIFLYAFK